MSTSNKRAVQWFGDFEHDLKSKNIALATEFFDDDCSWSHLVSFT